MPLLPLSKTFLNRDIQRTAPNQDIIETPEVQQRDKEMRYILLNVLKSVIDESLQMQQTNDVMSK